MAILSTKTQVILACLFSFLAGFSAAKAMDIFQPFSEIERSNALDKLKCTAGIRKSSMTNSSSSRSSVHDSKDDSNDMALRGTNVEEKIVEEPIATTTTTTTTPPIADETAAPSMALPTPAQDSYFNQIVQTAYQRVIQLETTSALKRNSFDIDYWENRSNLTTAGGLRTLDRILLAKVYGTANSLFEYGLGESTYMAHYLGVPRYAGIDSDPVWVDMARQKVDPNYRFYLADVGTTMDWGYPTDATLAKNVLNYQLAPLVVEQSPFDVYMVDGRFRMPTALACFIHASARGAPHDATTVLIHDCPRKMYHSNDHLLDMVENSGDLLCVYKRKPATTDAELVEAWHTYVDNVERR